jgi:hypothetical protein
MANIGVTRLPPRRGPRKLMLRSFRCSELRTHEKLSSPGVGRGFFVHR